MNKIDPAVLQTAMTYDEYRALIDRLLRENKTTGPNQNEAMLHYTTLNQVRMERLDKVTRLREETLAGLARTRRPLLWLVLTEAWCGDAAQVIPVLHKMSRAAGNIELKLILRDEHPAVMDAFLTNGGRSIPKLIMLDPDTRKVIGSWGPRPAEAQQIVMDGKDVMAKLTDPEEKKKTYQALAATLQKWYARDKTVSIQQEVLTAIQGIRAAHLPV